MAQYTRDDIIDSGIYYGMDYGDVDRALRSHGHSGLTFDEANRIKPINVGDIWKNTKQNAGNLIAGVVTAPAQVYASIRRGTALKDAAQLVRDFPNAALSTYNTSVQKLQKHGTSGLGWDMLSGVIDHPVEAGIDALTLGAGKVLKKGKNALAESKTLNNFVKDKPMLREAKGTLLPTKAQRKLNNALDLIEIDAKTITKDTAKEIQDFNRLRLKKNADIKQATRNARFGLMEGTKETQDLTKQIHKIAKMQSDKAIELGLLDKDYHYKNTLAQYITDMSKGKMVHGKAFKLVEKGLNGKLENQKELRLLKKAQKLFDEGKISYLSQVMKPTRGFGSLLEPVRPDAERSGYFSKGRWAGLTPPEVLAKALPETLDYVDEQIRKGHMAHEGVNYILDDVANKVKLEDIKNTASGLGKDEVLISKKAFNDLIKDALAGKKGLEKDIRTLDQTQEILNKYSNYKKKPIGKDVYKLNVEDLRALSNHVEGVKNSKLLSFLKRNMLVFPKWLTENRIGNFINNFMFGTGANHYLKALKKMKEAPEWLDVTTNYAAFTGGEALGSTMRTRLAYQAAWNKIIDGVDSIKTWEGPQFTRGAYKILDGLNDFFRLPIVAPEAFFEKLDRLANYIKQAERYAKKTGKTFDEVYDMSLKDRNLFGELNKEVDRELGNYTGRNYYAPNWMYKAVNSLYPFWKFPVESMRTTYRQMVERPLRYQTFVHTPAKYGARNWEEIKEALDLPEDDYTGGALYMNPKKINEPYQFLTPTGSPYEAIGRLFNIIGGNERSSMLGVNPMLKLPYQWIMGINGLGTKYRLDNTINVGDKTYELDSNSPYRIKAPDGSIVGIKLDEHGMPVEHEYSLLTDAPKIMLKDILKHGVVGYNQAQGLGRNLLFALNGQPMYSQYADVLNPFDKGDMTSLAKKTPTQKLGSQIGLQTSQVYPNYHMSNNQFKTLIKKIFRKLQGKGN